MPNNNSIPTITSSSSSMLSGGMSRAAKKKRKQKKMQQQHHHQEIVPSNNSTTTTSIKNSSSNEKKSIKHNNNNNSNEQKITKKQKLTTSNQHTSNKNSKNNSNMDDTIKFGIVNDDDFMLQEDDENYETKDQQQVHEDDDDDEIEENHDNDNNENENDDNDDDVVIPMKKPAKSKTTKSILPIECHRLYDILLLPSSNKSTTSTNTTTDTTSLLQLFESMSIQQRAQCAFEFLLQPSNISKSIFYNQYYEKLPLYCCYNAKNNIKNNSKIPTTTTTSSNNENHHNTHEQHTNRYTSIFSINDIQQMIQSNTLYYGTDLNVTRYEKSKHDNVYRRITLDRKKIKKKHKKNISNETNTQQQNDNDDNDEYEIVQYNDIWDQYMNHGCTIRLLCPQQYNTTIYTLLSLLEYEFNCMVGANIYLTPPNVSQGFAPHYDDIDAYIIQLEGYKRWKVYPPIEKNERLPRVSSKDYTSNDLINITPILDIVLESGDMLYIPRGWIHQACTISNDSNTTTTTDMTHSLHLTISTMQQWAWADYMEILLPEALNAAINAPYIALREGLPNGFLHYMGAMYDNREELLPDVLKSKLVSQKYNNDIGKGKSTNGSEVEGNDDDDNNNDDDNNDSMMIENRSRLQEEFRFQTKKRLMRVVKEAMDMIDAACDQMGKRFLSDRLPPALTSIELQKTNHSSSIRTITSDMVCQLVRPGIARLVLEDDMAILYHCNDNSRLYHEHPISPMEFEIDDAPALEQLLTTIPPNWIPISDLIHDTIDDKISIVQALFDEGILAIQHEVN